MEGNTLNSTCKQRSHAVLFLLTVFCVWLGTFSCTAFGTGVVCRGIYSVNMHAADIREVSFVSADGNDYVRLSLSIWKYFNSTIVTSVHSFEKDDNEINISILEKKTSFGPMPSFSDLYSVPPNEVFLPMYFFPPNGTTVITTGRQRTPVAKIYRRNGTTSIEMIAAAKTRIGD